MQGRRSAGFSAAGKIWKGTGSRSGFVCKYTPRPKSAHGRCIAKPLFRAMGGGGRPAAGNAKKLHKKRGASAIPLHKMPKLKNIH